MTTAKLLRREPTVSDPCPNHPSPEALEAMRSRGGLWACYQNHDLGHRDIGRLVFLQYGGPDSTFDSPPDRYPDVPEVGLGWRYLHVGFVDLKSGEIVDVEASA